MNEDLVVRFHEKALRVYEEGKRATGYRGTRYLQKVRKDGGLKAAKSWLKRRGKNDAPTGGFLKLVDFGRLAVSLEAQVVQDPWTQLFTTDELATARERLSRYGYFDAQTPSMQNGSTLPEELDLQDDYVEGAKTTVIINSFERNRKARDACVAHYGANCYVCDMAFEETYGAIAQGFIHVHHLCSPSAIGKAYRLDPVADLRPVCPNCHAMLHLRKPTFTIEEVRRMIDEKTEQGAPADAKKRRG